MTKRLMPKELRRRVSCLLKHQPKLKCRIAASKTYTLRCLRYVLASATEYLEDGLDAPSCLTGGTADGAIFAMRRRRHYRHCEPRTLFYPLVKKPSLVEVSGESYGVRGRETDSASNDEKRYGKGR